jgi:hypothetical protein
MRLSNLRACSISHDIQYDPFFDWPTLSREESIQDILRHHASRFESARGWGSQIRYEVKDVGTHSIRKGAATYASNCPGGPPAASMLIRAGWSMGRVRDIYLKWERGGDQFVGRCLSLLPLLKAEFGASPPHIARALYRWSGSMQQSAMYLLWWAACHLLFTCSRCAWLRSASTIEQQSKRGILITSHVLHVSYVIQRQWSLPYYPTQGFCIHGKVKPRVSTINSLVCLHM